MRFVILNEMQALSYTPQEKYIHIIISSPHSAFIKLPENSFRVSQLFLQFQDIDIRQDLVDCLTEDLQPISKSQARKIVQFFNKYKNEVNLTVINCEAGISRSSAIGASLTKLLGEDDSRFFKKYLPNMLVYRTILNEGSILNE